MRKYTATTLLFVRLFVESEGPGFLLASVPAGLAELADRVVEGDVEGFDLRVLKRGRWVFRLDPVLWPVQSDVRSIPREFLRRSQAEVQEALCRLRASGWETRPLLREELAYLMDCVPEGGWAPGITVVE